MDSEHLRLGEIITGDQQRDAVHIAVIPIEAGEPLAPGSRVAIGEGGRGYPGMLMGDGAVGVVDPYLRQVVQPGERFWLFLYPGSIRSLRHEWTHPAFPGKMSASETWLRDFAKGCGVPYDGMLKEIEEGGSVWVGNDDSSYTWREEFLFHAQAVLGEKFTEKHRDGIYFHCAC